MVDRAPCDASTELYDVVREEVHDAFEYVALSQACTLPMLLEETRARGLHDDDVRHVLVIDELDAASGVETDSPLRCARSKAGVLYVTRDVAAANDVAAMFEAFVELWSGEAG